MKRWIAMLLTVCMLISLCPVGAFAESATGGTEPAQTVQTEQDTADATGATKGTAAPAEGAPKENADANNAENGNAAANNGTGNAENKENATGTPKENAEASNAGNGNAAANNGTGNAGNKENATGATNEEPKAETKTCSCKNLCDMLDPNADCEVCANSNDVGTCCEGSVAKLDAVDPQPAAEEEELVCTTCTTKCTDGHVNDSCEACKADPSKCRIVEDNQALVDTYEFYVDGVLQDSWTQSLEEGQTLNVPGNPSKDGAVFQGWYRLDGGNKIPVVSGAVNGVSGKTVQVNAEFAEFSYVLFMSKDGSAVVHTAQGSSGNAVSDADLDTAAKMVNLSLSPTEAVVGWSSTLGGEAGTVAFAAGTVKVYPVTKTGYWVTFDANGGSYVAPIFAQNGETVTLPKATRLGYTFQGWYNGDTHVTEVTGTVELKAQWTADSNTKYTVIHWQENADDDGYSFAESEEKYGNTGEKTIATAKSYKDFTAKEITQVTISGDGSTIVNVYYKRNVYTITFHLSSPTYSCGKVKHTHSERNGCYSWRGKLICNKEEHTHSSSCKRITELTIIEKYGANISSQWPTVNGSSNWSVNSNVSDGPWQSNISTMPSGGTDFYGPKTGYNTAYAYYYVEALPGTTDTKYVLHHTDSAVYDNGWLSVTDEDKYPIAGFTYEKGTRNGADYSNAMFYYTRNSYNIVFMNNGSTDKTESLKFEESLNGKYYEPERPGNIPAGYEFQGWYDNEQGEGTAFVFEGKTMPAQNITLYAKWAAPKVTATVYLTVEVGGESKTLSVPYGSSLVEAPDYAELMQEITAKNGSAPSAWFSVDTDGAKTLFNPDTKLYGDVTLVPHFSGTVDTFKVTYVEENDQPGPVDGNDYQSGSYATVLSPIHGNLRFLYWENKANDNIYKPGESMKMSGDVTLTAMYTEAPATVGLTYHSGEVSSTETGIRSNTFTTVKSAAVLGFTAPDGYVFAGWSTTENGAATYFPGNAVYVPKDGADLYAVWTERTDLSYTVRYLEKGTDNQLSDVVLVSNQTLGASVNAADHKIVITGYKFDSATPETLTIGAEGNVIKLYYVKDADQTKNTSYTVRHVVDGEEKDTNTYTGTAWINETNPTIVIEASSLAQKSYTGYKFSSMSPADVKEGDAVASGTVITLTYVKDDEQTKNTKYTVKYTINGVEQSADEVEVTGKAWVNDNPAKITIAKGGIPAPADKYEGYKLDPANETYPTAGTKVNSGSVYTVNYVKDDSQTQGTKYTVKYTINGVEQTTDGFEVTGTAWVNDNPAKITIAKGGIPAPTDKYTGYKLDAANPAYPAEGTQVASGTVYTVNYVKDEGQTKPTSYTVRYTIEGVEQEADRITVNGTAWVNDNPVLIAIAEGGIPAPANKYIGYKLDAANPTYPAEGTQVASETVYTVNYVKDTFGYTVEYYYDGMKAGGETVHETALFDSQIDTYPDKCPAGYRLEKTENLPLTVSAKAEDNVIRVYYVIRTDLAYTVEYREVNSGAELRNAKQAENVTFGTVVSADDEIVKIPGYRFVRAEPETMEIGVEKSIMVLYYAYVPPAANTFTVQGPADVIYNGNVQQLKPVVRDGQTVLTEGVDYVLGYTGDLVNVGTVTITVTGIGKYEGTRTVTYRILPRAATITVADSSKRAGEKDPAFTGTVTGLVSADHLGTITYTRTNADEAVGLYRDVLDAAYTPNGNYTVTVVKGDFEITETGTQPTTEPTQPTESFPDDGGEEDIADEPTPLDMGGAWALVNLILTILTVLGSILLLIGYIGKKQKEREDENGNVILNAEGEAETDDIKKKGGWRLASIIPAVAAVIAFILTENMRLPMVLVDKWTLLMVIIALVQLLVAYFSKKKTQEPEQPEQMVANA